MKKVVIILSIAILALYGCGSGNQKEKEMGSNDDGAAVSGNILIGGVEILYPVMKKWKQEFEKKQPEVKIRITPGNADQCLKDIEDDKIQIAMVSRPIDAKEGTGSFWAVPVAKDAVLPVVSFDNANLQKIVLAGVTKEKLAAAFTGKISTWGALLSLKSTDPIEVYKLPDSSGTSYTWASFLNINTEKIIGTGVYNEKDIPMLVAANKNGIGYCSHTEIFDLNTGLKKRNLYVLPIDLNSSNQADDDELVFDKLDDMSRAISSGKYPSPPVRKLYLVCKKIPNDAATVSLIKWILTIGQSYCAQFGLVNIEKNEAAAYLKQLK